MATTGRIQVAPGQTVASSWGNTVFDQSLMCFTSAGDRDNQIPAGSRHAGMVVWLDDQKVYSGWDGTAWSTVAQPARRFRLWLTADSPVSPDDWVDVPLDGVDDPAGLTSGGRFVAPFAGTVMFAAAANLLLSGTAPTSLNLMGALWTASAETRRGNQLTFTAPPAGIQAFQSVIAAVLPVTAGQTVQLRMYTSAPQATKSFGGGPALTYLEGSYVG